MNLFRRSVKVINKNVCWLWTRWSIHVSISRITSSFSLNSSLVVGMVIKCTLHCRWWMCHNNNVGSLLLLFLGEILLLLLDNPPQKELNSLRINVMRRMIGGWCPHRETSTVCVSVILCCYEQIIIIIIPSWRLHPSCNTPWRDHSFPKYNQ